MTGAEQSGITRRNFGKGHAYYIDGLKVSGVTTIISATTPKPALITWAAESTADGVINRWEELQSLTPSKRRALLLKGRYDDVDKASKRGIEVHRLAEQHMAGLEVEVPDELDGHFRAYEQFFANWQPQPVLIEGVVANRTLGYCGTLDVVADLVDGHRWLLDYKTSRSGIFPETALQLTAYRRAEVYVDQNGAEQSMSNLDIKRVGALHLRADGSSLPPVEDSERTWNYFRHLLWLHRRLEQQREWVGSELNAPTVRAAS